MSVMFLDNTKDRSNAGIDTPEKESLKSQYDTKE